MKYYIIAGEASGDLHGSNLIKELHQLDADANILCWGGDMMQQAGAVLVKHYRDLAFMGFVEVIKNLPTILSNLKFCRQDILQFKPDVLVLIDYPGFNLRIAKWAKDQGLKIVYYISPQVWAWKESRVKGIRQWVDKMLVILPFEKEFYQKWNYSVDYVGHPLVQVIDDFLSSEQPLLTTNPFSIKGGAKEITDQQPIVALLPGSREQEIQIKLPLMLSASVKFPQYRFIIAQAPSQPYVLYKPMIEEYPNAELALPGQTYKLLSQARAALVTSGTATLETALFGVPQVVCYKGSNISYQIAKRLIKINYISLVNLIINKPVVKELIQHELTSSNIALELEMVLHDETAIRQMKADYADLKTLLQAGGNASAKAAQAIFQLTASPQA